MREAVFYLGRIVKTGFSQEDFINVIFNNNCAIINQKIEENSITNSHLPSS
jgi:hypothetical protein